MVQSLARVALRLICRTQVQCGRIEPELLAHNLLRDRERGVAVEVRARRGFGQPMPNLPDFAIADDGDPPFLGALQDIAIEAGKAHFP